MTKSNNDTPKRKYAWLDKWVKATGDRARIDAKVNNTYIVYEKDGRLVKEYPDGKIAPLNEGKEM